MSHLSVKAAVAAVVGLVVAVVAALLGVPDLSPLLGWAVAAAVFLAWAWSRAWPAGPERTRSLARHEDRSRKLVDTLIIVATFLSLVLVVLALVRSQQKDLVGSAAALLAVVGVVAAWALVNTVYAFKYARMYLHRRSPPVRLRPGRGAVLQRLRLHGVLDRDGVQREQHHPVVHAVASRRHGTRAPVVLLRHLRGRGRHQPRDRPHAGRVTVYGAGSSTGDASALCFREYPK